MSRIGDRQLRVLEACDRANRARANRAREPRSFTFTLELGNAAMMTGDDVARALRIAAAEVDDGDTTGRVRDENGNTVGRWEFV